MNFDSLDECKAFLTRNDIQIHGIHEKPQEIIPLIDPSRKRKKWTDIEIAFVRDNYARMKAKDIGKTLHRTRCSITTLIHNLNKRGAHLKKRNYPGRVKEVEYD